MYMWLERVDLRWTWEIWNTKCQNFSGGAFFGESEGGRGDKLEPYILTDAREKFSRKVFLEAHYGSEDTLSKTVDGYF